MQAYETDASSTRWAEASVLIRTNAGRKRNAASFFQPLYTRRKPVARRDKEGVLVEINDLFSVQHRISGDVGHRKDDFADKRCPLCQEERLPGRRPHHGLSL